MEYLRQISYSLKNIIHLLAVGLVSLSLLLAGCVKYNSEEGVSTIPELDWGQLASPAHDFSYLKQSSYRMDIWLIYTKGPSFIQKNKPHILDFKPNQIIDPESSRSFIHHFEDSNLSPEFNFNIEYDYYLFESGDSNMIFETLYNKNSELCLIRVINHFGE